MKNLIVTIILSAVALTVSAQIFMAGTMFSQT